MPIPIFDIAAIAAVQLRMLGKLAGQYAVPLGEDKGKAAVTALLGSVIPTSLGYGMVGGLVQHIPVVGPVLGVFTVGAFASAATFAVGKVFIQHFESGGTFLDFEPSEVRACLHGGVEEGAGRLGSNPSSRSPGARATTLSPGLPSGFPFHDAMEPRRSSRWRRPPAGPLPRTQTTRRR